MRFRYSGVIVNKFLACGFLLLAACSAPAPEHKGEASNPWLNVLYHGGEIQLGHYEIDDHTPAQTAAAMPVVMDAVFHDDPVIAGRAILLLVQMRAIQAVPVLIEALGDKGRKDRNSIVWALGSLHSRPHDCVPVLMEALGDEDAFVRTCAGFALRDFGRDAKPALPRLIAAMDDPVWNVRQAVISALGELGPDAAAAIPHLQEATKDPESGVSGAATEALGKIRK